MTRTVDGRCPQGHAYLLMGTGSLYCPHRDHEGRPATHPLGFLPRTPAFDSSTPGPAASTRIPGPMSAAVPAASMPDHPSSPARGRGNPLPRPPRARPPVVPTTQPPSTAASRALPAPGLLFPETD